MKWEDDMRLEELKADKDLTQEISRQQEFWEARIKRSLPMAEEIDARIRSLESECDHAHKMHQAKCQECHDLIRVNGLLREQMAHQESATIHKLRRARYDIDRKLRAYDQYHPGVAPLLQEIIDTSDSDYGI